VLHHFSSGRRWPRRARLPYRFYRPRLEQLESRVAPATITVTTASLSHQPGETTFLDALGQANQDPGLDTIKFNMPGPGPHVISEKNYGFDPNRIIYPVIIDATLGLNFTPTTPQIVLDVPNIGIDILPTAAGSTIRGLAITTSFSPWFTGIRLQGSGNYIEGNTIGFDPSGTVPSGATDPDIPTAGILVQSAGNTIGGPAPDPTGGSSAFDPGNVIGGNTYGIFIDGPFGGTETTIQGNKIGMRGDGSTPAPNVEGILVYSSDGNTIGGSAATRNVVSGNSNTNIELRGYCWDLGSGCSGCFRHRPGSRCPACRPPLRVPWSWRIPQGAG